MRQHKKIGAVALISVVVGGLLGVSISALFFSPGDGGADASVASSDEPLYWVAPMDPNYRRDAPGKSPMGMDLIPVYAEQSSDAGPGSITVSPEVINNLGVRSAPAVKAILAPKIHTVGYVQYDADRLVHIHPRVEGWVEKLYITSSGDPVERGQPLYALYSPQLVNAQEEYLLALSRQNDRLIQAAEDRLESLQLDKTFVQQLKKSRAVSQHVIFHAPQTGVVDNLNIREGFFVQPGTTLMSIATLDEVWVEAEVFERQAAFVQLGLPVSMTLDYLPGKTWLGKVDYVYPSLDPKTRTVRARLRFSNEDNALKPNMFAQVAIHAHTKEAVLVVPREAVIRTGDQERVVLALGAGRFKSVAVTMGRSDQTHIEIKEGLDEGDEVVVSAQFLLDSESNKTSDFKRMHQPGVSESDGDDINYDDLDHTETDHADMHH